MTRRLVSLAICGAASLSLSLVSLRGVAASGQFCGGVAGVGCPPGEHCSMAGCNHPDCGGRCVDGSVPQPPDSPPQSKCDLVAHPPMHYISGWADVDRLKDDELFDRARAVFPGDKIKGHIGACWISDYSPRGAGRHGLACDYYVKSSKSDICGDGCAQSPQEAVARLRVAVALGYCDGAGTPGGPVKAK
jgi:hypothetical protein